MNTQSPEERARELSKKIFKLCFDKNMSNILTTKEMNVALDEIVKSIDLTTLIQKSDERDELAKDLVEERDSYKQKAEEALDANRYANIAIGDMANECKKYHEKAEALDWVEENNPIIIKVSTGWTVIPLNEKSQICRDKSLLSAIIAARKETNKLK